MKNFRGDGYRKLAFWLATVSSLVLLVSLWWASVRNDLTSLGNQPFRGLALEQSQGALGELRGQAQDSLSSFRERARELMRLFDTATTTNAENTEYRSPKSKTMPNE